MSFDIQAEYYNVVESKFIECAEELMNRFNINLSDLIDILKNNFNEDDIIQIQQLEHS